MTSFDKVISSLRYLDLHPRARADYNSRYLIQKITFLNQALGMDTNYLFTIYTAGPYSPALAKDYYSQSFRLDTLESRYQPTPSDIERLDKIRNCCGILENSSLMEATSTFVYLIKVGIVQDDEIIKRIRVIKPHLNYENLIIGLSRAKELLFKPEYLTEDLKREGDQWESIEK
jgi:hypothetical protein